MADPEAPSKKKQRLDSVYNNGHAFPPPPPPHAHHPTPIPASSPPPPRHFASHSLPPPPQPYPSSGAGPYPVPLPTSTLAPTDIRSFADPRTIPSPSQRPNGGLNPSPVTTSFSQDNISTYRGPQTPQASTASESVDVKPPSGMEHGNHQGSWSMNHDHRANGSVSNGYGQSMSPSHPNDPAYHPPPPPQGQYGQSIPYAPSPYMGQYSGSGQAQMRRKQVRATQACNHCRSRKQKCDEARPCQFCRENNFDCQYKDVPPPKQDRSMMQLQDSVNNISDVLRDFIHEIGAWRRDVDARLPSSQRFGSTANIASPDAAFVLPRDPGASRVPTPAQGRSAPRSVGSFKMESPMFPHPNMSPINAQVSTPIKQESTMVLSQQPATPAESVGTDNSGGSNAAKQDVVVKQDKAGLQSDHTTPAHKLLEEWGLMDTFPSNVEYLQRLKDNGQKYSDYPVQLEQARGSLRIWGVGEGHDANDGMQGPGSPESSNDSDAPSPAPGKEGLWGHPPLDHLSPHPMSSSTPRQYSVDELSAGGLTPDGRPDFSSAVVDRFHKSYMEHMHTLHPFLSEGKLSKMIQDFKKDYSPDARAANASSPVAHQLNPGVKRKRTSNAFGEPCSPRGAIEHSLRNAIVLLVLALGQVCCYKSPLPSPQSDKGSPTSGSWGSFGSNPNGSFGSETSEDTRPKNINILPGLVYYAYATDIIGGSHHGGTTVGHAQAFLLAALYIGQYARVLESWSWIHHACAVIVVLIKQDTNKLHRYKQATNDGKQAKELSSRERHRLESMLLVFWTCVQMESDILAEISILPTSTVTQYQNTIMYPKGVHDRFPEGGPEELVSGPEVKRQEDDRELMIYSSQIWMRVIINEAHNALYGANGIKSFDSSNIKVLAEHATSQIDILNSWRRVLPPFLRWEDGDPPATDLNIARLRAKYYGGLYMMLRPHLRIATHEIEYPPSHLSSQRNPQWSHHNSPMATGEVSTPISRSVPMMDLSESQQQIVHLACQCIESAIQSTIAFDRVGAAEDSPYEWFQSTRQTRLILTNIFGTLHAQFGNMLVLAAVYKSKLYPHLPDNTSLTPKNLHALFTRTLNVLDEVAPNSSVLKLDSEILRNVRAQLKL